MFMFLLEIYCKKYKQVIHTQKHIKIYYIVHTQKHYTLKTQIPIYEKIILYSKDYNTWVHILTNILHTLHHLHQHHHPQDWQEHQQEL